MQPPGVPPQYLGGTGYIIQPSLETNKELAHQLDQIAEIYSNSTVNSSNRFREGVYSTAARKIRGLQVPVVSGLDTKNKVGAGIGTSLIEDIDSFFSTGAVTRLAILRSGGNPSHRRAQEPPPLAGSQAIPTSGVTSRPVSQRVVQTEEERTLALFKSVYGIGAVKARKLYDQGYRNVESIPISELTSAQQLGIKYLLHFEVPIPRWEIDLIKNRIASYLNPVGIRWEIAGSYRRGAPTSGDIDVLIQEVDVIDVSTQNRRPLHMKDIISLLHSPPMPILVDDLSMGDKKYAGVARLSNEYNAHRIDIRLVPEVSWFYALLYFTGSGDFNRRMREFARTHKNYTLNEYGLTDLGGGTSYFPASSEEDIFRYLDLRYIPPSGRTPDAPLLLREG